MGFHEIRKLLHNNENDEQNEEASYRRKYLAVMCFKTRFYMHTYVHMHLKRLVQNYTYMCTSLCGCMHVLMEDRRGWQIFRSCGSGCCELPDMSAHITYD